MMEKIRWKNHATLALTVALTGCQATQRQNATTGESETNSATQGALVVQSLKILPLLVLLPVTLKTVVKRALIGAAGGAAVGGGIGCTTLTDKKRHFVKLWWTPGVQVERVGENQLLLRLENGIGFDSGSYALESSIRTLRGVARILVEYPDTSLVIEGHTDSTGSESTNQILSERRAESVRAFLISQDVAADSCHCSLVTANVTYYATTTHLKAELVTDA